MMMIEPTLLSQGGGPEPTHLILCGSLLLIIALAAIVLFLLRRQEQPWRVKAEAAIPRPAQPEEVSKVPRIKKGYASRAVGFTINLFSSFVAAIFAVLFFVSALLTLILFNVGRQLFDPDLYKRALVEQGVYEKFPALVADQMTFQLAYAEKRAGTDIENMTASPELEACLRGALGDEAFEAIAAFEREPDDAEIEGMKPCFAQYGETESDGGGGPPPGLATLTPADWEAILSHLIPSAWMQAQTESLIDQAFASLESDGPAPPITISLTALREHLAGGAAVEAFLQVVRARPPCNEEQLAALAIEPLGDLPTCRPPEAILDALAQEGGEILSEAILDIPDEVNLSKAFQGEGEPGAAQPSEGGGPFGNNPRQTLRWIRVGLNLSPLLPIVLLLLVTLFGVRSWRGWLSWWGALFFFVGFTGLGMALVVLPAMNWAIDAYVVGKLPPSISPDLAQVGLDVGRYIVRTLVTWIGGEAGVIALVGVALLLGLFFVRPKRK
ncbi:MAG: hypothetical protein FJ010_02245 [Chloroflexi bacterium]|nr:hypothetical protein [Chloroflexota bacterium]